MTHIRRTTPHTTYLLKPLSKKNKDYDLQLFLLFFQDYLLKPLSKKNKDYDCQKLKASRPYYNLKPLSKKNKDYDLPTGHRLVSGFFLETPLQKKQGL